LVKGQFSYDSYLKNADRIYRVVTHVDGDRNYRVATTTIPLANLIKNEITGVEKVSLMNRWFSGDGYANGKEIPISGKLADNTFFEILQFEFEEGDPSTALSRSDGIVLTYETAQKFFGNEPALGKPFQISDLYNAPKEGPHKDFFTVTGVLKKTDNVSHVDFDAMLSFELIKEFMAKKRLQMESLDDWEDTYQNYIYLSLAENQSAEEVELQISNAIQKHLTSSEEENKSTTSFKLQNVRKITPYFGENYSNQAGHSFPIVALLLLIGISAVIMLSAIFNYTNLSMARSITRAKEIGVRKVNGASRWQVRTQFILEAIVLSCISLIVAIAFLQFLIPAFLNLLGENISLNLENSPTIYAWFVGFAILMGILAGIFPSFYIAQFNAIQILKKIGNMQLMGKLTLTKGLIVIQFSLSMIFISTALLFHQQFNYVLNMDLGIKGENILEVDLNKNDFQLVEEKFLQFPEVENVAGVSHLPGGGTIYSTRVYTQGKQDSLMVYTMNVTPNFIDQVGIKMLAGNFFDNTVPRQSAMQYLVINQKALETLHYNSPNDAIGQQLVIGDSTQVEIIGVTANFTNKSIQQEVAAMTIHNNEDAFRYASVKINSDNYPETIKKLEAAWQAFDPVHPFTYRFFDKQIGDDFKFLTMLTKLTGFAGFLAVVIAAIGFLGMAIFNTNNKLKEIAIRKVHGAQLKGLFILLSKNFMILMGIAAVVSTPLAYLVNSLWLQEFPKKTEIGAPIFAIAIGLTFFIGLLTIAPQLWRVAVSNPADTLRNE